ncbi:MAG: tyrosine-type recombinase/integrase, partial [Phycisphaerae bacterium]|nr:tyrosine-type recombinase/integrase [Phycisphaerae bacterium]
DGRITGGHLANFHAALLAKGVTAKHANMKRSQAAWVLKLCKARHLPDLKATEVQLAMRTLRDDEGLSLQTLNHYLRSIKQFSRWLWRDGRCPENVLVHLSGYNARLDRRHDRRSLTDDEAKWLVRTTDSSGEAFGLSGADRAMLYRLAMGTGFRRNELRSLTPESFELDADPPTVIVEAAYSKRRRRDVQPIHRDLADMVHLWLGSKRAGTQCPLRELPVFDTTDAHWHRTSRMLRGDLEAARTAWLAEIKSPELRRQQKQTSFLAYCDAAGLVADFHALRHTYITNIGRGGASMKTHQELARHSEPGLTMRYTHPHISDKTAALNALPSLTGMEPQLQQARATGTDDMVVRNDPGEKPEAHTTARRGPCKPTLVTGRQQAARRGGGRLALQVFAKATTCQHMSAGGRQSRKHARRDSNP